MRLSLAPAVIPAVLVLLGGCSAPKFAPERIQVGMSEAQIVGLLGKPTSTAQLDSIRYLEYETFEQDRWFSTGRKENFQYFTVRLVADKTETFGWKGSSTLAQLPVQATEATPKAKPEAPQAAPSPKPPTPAAFDLRTELEKLEQLKKDGLITEAEFKDLRQAALDKAKVK